MVKKVKGIKVSKELQEKFKFDEEGNSQLGDSAESTHALKGAVEATGSVESVGQTTLTERLSGYTFSPPHIDASAEIQIVQDLIDNAAAMYEGFLVYITNAAAGEPFVQSNKFYFCEDGEWFPSPFESVITNHAPNVNPLYEVSVPAPGTETLPFSLDLPADLFQDQDGDPLVYTATQTDGNPLPAWLSFDATNTILSGTPTESDIGLLNLTITATDPGNLSASTTQEIQIFARPIPFWAAAAKEGYSTTSYPLDDMLYANENNVLVIDPYYNGDYLVTAPNIVDITAGPIVIDLEFDSALTDGMGIRWGSPAGGTYAHSRFCFGLVAPGGGTKKIWLGAAFVQHEEGSNGAYAEDDSSLDVTPMEAHTSDGNAYADSSNSWYFKKTSYYRDAPQKPWQSPSDRMVQVPDIDFRIIIDGYRRPSINPDNDMIDVTIVARHKTLPQSAIDDGYNLTLDDLYDQSVYLGIPAKYQDSVFHRTVQSIPLYGTTNPTGDFQPFVYFYGGNHNQANYSPNFAAAAPVITSWVQTAYLPPVCNYPNSITQLLYTGGPTQETLEADFFESQNDYSKSITSPALGTEIEYSAELLDGSPLPAWISLDSASRTFTFTPQSGDIGMHSIKIIGTDGAGMSSEVSRTYEVQQAPASAGTDITFPDGADPSPLVLDPDGTLTIVNPPVGNHIWQASPIQIPTGKKLLVKWEFEPLDNGEVMMESNGSYNNALAILVGDGTGHAWKYFQTRRGVGHPAIGYFRYSGSGISPTPNTNTANIDLLSSEFRMEITHDGFVQTTKMKIRPKGGSTSFDELTDESQTGDGYFYEEETHNTTSDEVKVWLNGFTQVYDASDQFRKFDYLRYELIDE